MTETDSVVHCDGQEHCLLQVEAAQEVDHPEDVEDGHCEGSDDEVEEEWVHAVHCCQLNQQKRAQKVFLCLPYPIHLAAHQDGGGLLDPGDPTGLLH